MKLKFNLLVIAGLGICIACNQSASNAPINEKIVGQKNIAEEKSVAEIQVPQGFQRISAADTSFHEYLKSIELKKDKTVYLYDGKPKLNQSAQYSVLNISVGSKDLQQCADAVMRLRAEYFYKLGKYESIEFYNGRREKINYKNWLSGKQNSRAEFLKYMEHVFNYCGTASLPYSVKNKPILQMQPGDILLKPGSPGHTVIVMDIAQNSVGEKIYLLAQSYMPAQDIHILKNPVNKVLSPWYELNEDKVIETPEWTFYNNQLCEWKD